MRCFAPQLLRMATPRFETDDDQRSLVKSLAMLGLQQEQICQVVGIRSPKTLRKHFRSELTSGGLHAMAKVMQTAYEMATSGRYPAMTMFWEKCQRDAQAEREREQLEKERLEALRNPPLSIIFAEKKEEDAE